MPITVPCVKCKTKFQVPSKLAGTTVRCKSCGCMLRLPSPEKIRAKKNAKPATSSTNASAVSKPIPARQTTAGNELTDVETLIPFEDAEAPTELVEFEGSGAAAAANKAVTELTTEPTVLSCSHCDGLLYYDPNFANQTVACPHCGNHLVMPQL